ncbi:FAM96B protein [Mycena latifolia]|nr:FAM96B protein [Mycena latifolia]
MVEIFNPNPTIFAPVKSAKSSKTESLWVSDPLDARAEGDEAELEELIDQDEIFDLIRSIYDPEHPNTLEELRVVSAPQITVSGNRVNVEFTPTVPHCGMSTLIGLSIRVRLLRALPSRFKIDITLKPGSHQSELAVNKQLNDKERVAAALENPALVQTLEQSLANASLRGQAAEV